MELNKIHEADCTKFMQSLPDESIDCILTDPPYLYLKNQKLDRPFEEQLFFNEAKRVIKKDGFIILFGRGSSFYRWNTTLANLGFTFKEEIVWDKVYNSSPVLPIQRFHETISIHTISGKIYTSVKVPYVEQKAHNIDSIVGDINRIKSALGNTTELNAMELYLKTRIKPISKRRNDKTNGCTISRNSTGVFHIPASVLSTIVEGTREKDIIKIPHDRYSRIHPTQKPVRLLERLLALTTKVGDIVFDPFAGSCSTAKACINTNRNYICCEMDDEYYKKGKESVNSHLRNVI